MGSDELKCRKISKKYRDMETQTYFKKLNPFIKPTPTGLQKKKTRKEVEKTGQFNLQAA